MPGTRPGMTRVWNRSCAGSFASSATSCCLRSPLSSSSPAYWRSTPSPTARGSFRWRPCRAPRSTHRQPLHAWPKRSASGPFQATRNPISTPKRCAACVRILKRAFRHFMPRPNAKSSVATACSTHGQAPTRGRSRSHCSRIRTSCRWRRAPRRIGNSRPLTGSYQTASSGAAAPGMTRATFIPCWRPPRRWPRPASAPSERSILRSAMTRRPPAPPAPNRSRRCSPRAASASTS